MTVKAGQKCTAIRRAIVPRQHARRGGRAPARRGSPRSSSATRRSRTCAWARWPRRRSSADVAERVALLAARQRDRVRRSATASRRWARASADGAFFAPTLLLCRDRMTNDAVHDIEAFGPVSTLMPYDDLDEALALAARGKRQPGRARW